MRRREFITLLGGATVAWPLGAHAQQGGKLATVGLLGSSTAAAQNQWTAALGRNLAIEYRWAEGHTERLPKLANELVRLKVDVIVTQTLHPRSPQSGRHLGFRCSSADLWKLGSLFPLALQQDDDNRYSRRWLSGRARR
jgi:hypothetical protein